MSRRFRIFISLLATATLLYVFFRLTKFRDFFHIVEILSRFEVGLLVILSLIGTATWSLMVYAMYKEQGIRTKYFVFLPTFLKAFFIKRTNPLGEFGGEFFMSYVFSQDLKIEYSKAMGIAFSSGVLTSIPSFAFVFFGLSFLFLRYDVGFSRYIVSPFIFLLVFIGIVYLIIAKRHSVERLIVLFYQKLHWNPVCVRVSIKKFYLALDVALMRKKYLVRVVFYATLALLQEVVLLFFVLQIFGAFVPFIGLLFVVPVAFLAIHLPLPGGAGGVELSLSAILHFILGVPLGIAASAVLIYRVIDFWLPVAIGGGVFGISSLRKKFVK